MKTHAEIRAIVHKIHEAFIDAKTEDGKLKDVEFIEEQLNALSLDPTTRETIDKQLHDEIFGFGPINDFLSEDDITEVMVNGPHTIYIERKGKLILTDRHFDSEEHLQRIIRLRIVDPMGRRMDESSPSVDARLEDGSRVHAELYVTAIDGTALNIRRFPRISYTPVDLIEMGTWSQDMCEFLQACVEGRLNMVISGGTGSGKTTTLNILSGFIPDSERIITIEDAAELQLQNSHVVRLETRPPNLEGKGEITTRHLVKSTLRMRPDRIIVGECRGEEAHDMMQAMNTGHDGSMTTAHTNSPVDTLSRLENMIFMAGVQASPIAIRREIVSAMSLIVHQQRCRDGQRRVTHITEIAGMEGGKILLQDIFLMHSQEETPGVRRFWHGATRIPPIRTLEKLEGHGIILDRKMFEN